MSEVKEVLVEARRIVEHGWSQGHSTDGEGNFCLRAAVELASGFKVVVGNRVAHPTLGADAANIVRYSKAARLDIKAAQAVVEFLPEGKESIVRFNDDPATTHTDVLAILDKAISAC